MLHIRKIDDNLKNLHDEEVKNINFSEFSKSIREEQNHRTLAKLM